MISVSRDHKSIMLCEREQGQESVELGVLPGLVEVLGEVAVVVLPLGAEEAATGAVGVSGDQRLGLRHQPVNADAVAQDFAHHVVEADGPGVAV